MLSLLRAPAVGAEPPAQLPRVEIVSPSPLPGLALPKDQIPGNVQSTSAADLSNRHAVDLTSHLSRVLGSINLNEVQGNPFQPDLNYRGFAASPLLGTPQGLSVYLDGVRLNQPFGDTVSWDLIPRAAIERVALMPGSNPLFGLNTLGGAIAVETKSGWQHRGSSVQLSGGSNRRLALEFESGGGRPDGVDWFITGNRYHETGWRSASPSDLVQLFAKLGTRGEDSHAAVTVALADNRLTGNGLQEEGRLGRDYRSVYTSPDRTHNRSLFLNLTSSIYLIEGLTVSGNAYLRSTTTYTVSGDVNPGVSGQSLYPLTTMEVAALTAAGYAGFPAPGGEAAHAPFPKWRCVAQALLGSTPSQTCDGLINRTRTNQDNGGLTLQAAMEASIGTIGHRMLLGAGLDASRVRFIQNAQFGYIEANRVVQPVLGAGASATGSNSSADALDARVDLGSQSRTTSLFGSDTVEFDPKTHLTIAGRYNYYKFRNVDGIHPGGGIGSLDGDGIYSHFNPALGLTFAATGALTIYAGVNSGTRAPTAAELGCADRATPCKLPNGYASDPPLRQVITTTWEAGARGVIEGARWNASVFRSDNQDDLLFVADNAYGYGYFRNFGRTRRQGVELGLSTAPVHGLRWGANVTFLEATYRSHEVIGASGNSSNDAAAAGLAGVDGNIRIAPGDRIPLLPRHFLKLYVDLDVGTRWHIGADLNAVSGAEARGNENGEHVPDGIYYNGPGRSAAYALVNVDADYRPNARMSFFVQISNLLDRRYGTAAQLGVNRFDAKGNFSTGGLTRNANGDYPQMHGTFLAPGAPRAVLVGARYLFPD